MEYQEKICLFIILILLFIAILYFTHKLVETAPIVENLCNSNASCYGDQALCINQRCNKCGLEKECTRDRQCGANNCNRTKRKAENGKMIRNEIGCCDNA
jgi:hypothetical protein